MELNNISKITNQIYLSGIIPLVSLPKNIKFILSCVDNPSARYMHKKISAERPDIIILYVPYDDVLTQNLWQTNRNQVSMTPSSQQLLKMYQGRSMIEIGYHFMNNVIESGQNVLIHCMAGISRSVSMIIYYFMKKKGVRYEDAYNYIYQRRSIAYPNHCFRKQLQLYNIFREKFTEKDCEKIIKNI